MTPVSPGDRIARVRAALATVALVAGLLVAGSGSALAQGAAPPPTVAPPLERVSAAVRPALVGVRTELRGDLFLPDRTPVGRYTSTATCSGVGVGAEGYVATDDRCLGDAQNSQRLLQAAADDLAGQQGRSAESWLALLRLARVTVEAPGGGGGPTEITTVSGPLGPTSSLPGRVVARDADDRAHAALVKVETTALPTLELAASDPPSGTAVTAAGFTAPDTAASPTAEPTYAEARTAGSPTAAGTPLSGVGATMTRETTGGPTVDAAGRLVGINDTSGAGTFDVAPASALRELAAGTGITLRSGPADQMFRTGVTAYYEGRYSDAIEQFDGALAARPGDRFVTTMRDRATSARDRFGDPGPPAWVWWAIGVAVLLVVVAVVVLLLVLRRRRRQRQRHHGTAPFGAPGGWSGPGPAWSGGPPGPYPPGTAPWPHPGQPTGQPTWPQGHGSAPPRPAGYGPHPSHQPPARPPGVWSGGGAGPPRPGPVSPWAEPPDGATTRVDHTTGTSGTSGAGPEATVTAVPPDDRGPGAVKDPSDPSEPPRRS